MSASSTSVIALWETRNSTARSECNGSLPPLSDATHTRLNHQRKCLSESLSNFGSCRARAYALHQRPLNSWTPLPVHQ